MTGRNTIRIQPKPEGTLPNEAGEGVYLFRGGGKHFLSPTAQLTASLQSRPTFQ